MPYYTTSIRGDGDMVNKELTADIGGIQVGIMRPDDIREMSAVHVTTHEAFVKDATGKDIPVIDGIHDLHMGSMDKDVACLTCDRAYNEQDAAASCPGHFGHIELETPIPKIMYLGIEKNDGKPGDPLLFTLNHVCHSCSNILLLMR